MKVRLVRRGALVVYAHPVGVAERVRQWAAQVAALGPAEVPPRVLVVGCSAGLGLATRVTATVAGSHTIGVCHARPPAPNRPGTPGWYATAAVHELAAPAGGLARTVVADAFSDEAKRAVAEVVRETVGRLDLVVYSIAAARRRHPDTGVVEQSVIRTLGAPYTDKDYDLTSGEVRTTTLPGATPAEVAGTVAVMGGDDWARWWSALEAADVLAGGARTLAFSYEGGARLRATYRDGTLGAAKDDLEATARRLDGGARDGRRAQVAVMAATVTQSSAAIPTSALYWMLLAGVLGPRGLLEGPPQQAHRLLADVLHGGTTDDRGRLRLDDRELQPAVQDEVARRWDAVRTDNLAELGRPADYVRELERCAGFSVPGVDEDADVDVLCPIPGLVHA